MKTPTPMRLPAPRSSPGRRDLMIAIALVAVFAAAVPLWPAPAGVGSPQAMALVGAGVPSGAGVPTPDQRVSEPQALQADAETTGRSVGAYDH